MNDIRGTHPSSVTARSTSVAGNRSRLMKACRQVEGLFLSRLMEAMDRPTFGEGVLKQSRATALFRSRHNQAIADEMGMRGELGLAKMLYNDLTNPAEDAEGVGAAGSNRSTPAEGAETR